jgi:hypothetical protein
MAIGLASCGSGDDESSASPAGEAATTSASVDATPSTSVTDGPAAPTSGTDLLDTPVSGPGFTAWMPGKATTQPYDAKTRSGETVTGKLYIYQDGTQGYSVGQFPLGEGDSFDLKVGVQRSADGVKGHVVSQGPVSFLGLPGRDAQIAYSDDGDSINFFSRFLSSVNRVFVLTYMVFGDGFTAPPAEFKTFVENFRPTEAIGSGT